MDRREKFRDSDEEPEHPDVHHAADGLGTAEVATPVAHAVRSALAVVADTLSSKRAE